MALIKCPECGKDVSEHSSACIYCGCPLSKGQQSTMDGNPIHGGTPTKKVTTKSKTIICCLVVVLLIAITATFIIGRQSEAAKAVDEMISSIGEVSLDNEFAISNAEAAYEALEDKDQKQVKLYDTLLASRKEFDTLREKSIVGVWEFEKDGVSLRFEFNKNGEFHSYVIMFGKQVPGGDGTYIVNDNEITTTMASGDIIEPQEFKEPLKNSP